MFRLIREQIAEAYSLANGEAGREFQNSIHELRKCFKRLRAIFRLLRTVMGEGLYRAENNFFRDLGREISVIRDHQAVIEALQQLKTYYKVENLPFFKLAISSFNASRQAREEQFLQENGIQNIRSLLEQKHTPGIQAISFDHLFPNLARTYKRGRQALEIAKAGRFPEHFHEWRKQVKYLRYQIEIFTVAWPGLIGALEKEFHHLSDLLGLDHDLFLIEKQINGDLVEFKDDLEKALLISLIGHYKDHLETEALALGQNLYLDRSNDFVGRLRTYWSNYTNI